MTFDTIPELEAKYHDDPNPPQVGQVHDVDGKQVRFTKAKLVSAIHLMAKLDENEDCIAVRDHASRPFCKWLVMWEPVTDSAQ